MAQGLTPARSPELVRRTRTSPARRRIEIHEPNGVRREPQTHEPPLADRIAADLKLGFGIGLDGDLFDQVVEEELQVFVLPLPDRRKIRGQRERANRRDAQVHAIGALFGKRKASKTKAV